MNFLKKLQAKPYEERVRILRIAGVLTVVIVIGLWIATLRLRSSGQTGTSIFDKFFENLTELKSKFK